LTIPILVALLTAAGTFWGGYLIEGYKRHRDKQALAASILSEVTAILDIQTQLRIEDRYHELRAAMAKAQGEGAAWRGMRSDTMAFPVSVYEKSADRVGTLGAETASEVVRFYNFVEGFRTGVRIAIGEGDLPIEGRIATVDFLLSVLASERSRAGELQSRLRAVAGQKWLFVLT
jgi:hypothetical protein